jgi:carbon monoxide dehydrogenase subunit G
MITIENYLAVDKDIASVWKFFNDVAAIAGCVPTCKSFVKIDENTVNCDLRLKLGLIPLDSKAVVSITDRKNDRHLEAKGETEPGEITKKFGKVVTESKTKLHIILDLEEISPTNTRIHFKINADAVGQMRRIYESVISGQRAKIESQFVANIGKVMGANIVIEGLPQGTVA